MLRLPSPARIVGELSSSARRGASSTTHHHHPLLLPLPQQLHTFGADLTSTRHMRQFPATESRWW